MTARSAKTFQLVAVVLSKTNPDKEYEISRHRVTGKLSCNCMSYAVSATCPTCGEKTTPVDHDHRRCRYHGEVERSCKHLRGYLRDAQTTPVVKTTPSAPLSGKVPSHLTPKGASPLEAALIAAAVAVGVRGMMSDASWRKLATRFETTLPSTTITYTAPVETLDADIVRRIVLED